MDLVTRGWFELINHNWFFNFLTTHKVFSSYAEAFDYASSHFADDQEVSIYQLSNVR